MDNTELPISELPSLQVSVLWSEIEPSKSASEFPKMVGEEQLLVEATDGKPGGFAMGQTL
jgi:tyrosinase